jgi:polyhydroxyalkanoate synthase
VANYLLAEEALPFDMNHWFADAARMPARMLSSYLREIVLKNGLAEPGRIELAGVPVDLGRIEVPTCFVALRDDHVAPWRSVYAGVGKFAGPTRFLLGGSGHNAGTINPPAANRHGYWTNPQPAPTADAWLAEAVRHEGSWWPDWAVWLEGFDGGRVAARAVGAGAGALPPLEPAPGSYVKVRA